MRVMLQTLLMFAVLLATLHVGEAHAHEAAAEHALEQAAASADGPALGKSPVPDDTSGADDENRLHHHHCPVAASAQLGGPVPAAARLRALHFAMPAAALGSLSPAPPVEPPLV